MQTCTSSLCRKGANLCSPGRNQSRTHARPMSHASSNQAQPFDFLFLRGEPPREGGPAPALGRPGLGSWAIMMKARSRCRSRTWTRAGPGCAVSRRARQTCDDDSEDSDDSDSPGKGSPQTKTHRFKHASIQTRIDSNTSTHRRRRCNGAAGPGRAGPGRAGHRQAGGGAGGVIGSCRCA